MPAPSTGITVTRKRPAGSPSRSFTRDRGINFPFGAAIELRKRLTPLPSYDGQAAHTQLTYTRGQQTLSLIAAWSRRLGISFGYGF